MSSSRLPDTVYETTCMALSEGKGNLLAVGWRVLEEGLMTIMDLKTGDRIHTIQSHHFLSSIQVYFCFRSIIFSLLIVCLTLLGNFSVKCIFREKSKMNFIFFYPICDTFSSEKKTLLSSLG